MTVEFTAFDNGIELGTFDVQLSANPVVGDIIDGMVIVAIRR